MAPNRELSLRVEGLAKLRRDLRAIDKDLGKSLTDHLRDLAKEVRDEARSRAPVKTGALQRSIKHSVRARGASIYSNTPYAGVQEWGGTIRPKGTPIEIQGRHFIYSAIYDHADHIKGQVEGLLDGIADRHGFN